MNIQKKARSSRHERRRAFFYAEADADVYDASADLNTPQFTLMHQTLHHLAHSHLRMLRGEVTILDIGSGTGAESVPLLKAFPEARVVAVDLCAPMHAIYKRKASASVGATRARDDVRSLTGDIAGPLGTPNRLLRAKAGWGNARGYDLVISGLTLHHLDTAEKRRVYRRIHSVLRSGGVFLNADLFTFHSPQMAKLALRFALDWIQRQFTDPDPHLRVAKQRLGGRAARLRDAWLSHYRKFNLPDPIESRADGYRTAPNDAGQSAMLMRAGFNEVACPFRFWEVGILWAKK